MITRNYMVRWIRTLRFSPLCGNFILIAPLSVAKRNYLSQPQKVYDFPMDININDDKELIQSGSSALTLDELWALLEDPSTTNGDFKLNVYRVLKMKINTPLPIGVIQAIKARIPQISSKDSQYITDIMYLLGSLRVTIANFDHTLQTLMLAACETALTENPKVFFRVISGLSYMKFTASQFNSTLIALIENSLMKALVESPSEIIFTINTLAHLKVYWPVLSPVVKRVIEATLNSALPKMNSVELEKLLFSLALMKVIHEDLDFTDVMKRVTVHCKTADIDLLVKYFNAISSLKIPYSLLSNDLRMKMDEAFITAIKRGHRHALYNLSKLLHNLQQLNAREKYMSYELRNFISQELATYLVKTNSEDFSRNIKVISDLKFKWKRISLSSQKLIISHLIQSIPTFSNSNYFFVMSGLIKMQPNYKSLPLKLQEHIQSSLLEILPLSNAKGVPAMIDSMSKCGLKYADLNNELKECLKITLATSIPLMDEGGVSIVVKALYRMESPANEFIK